MTTIHDPRSIADEGESLEIAPFAFWPAYRSRLSGLGGEEAGEDPDYVFHTLYIACGSGPVTFRVLISGLVAERGTLITRVHELPDGVGSHARQIAIAQSQLVDIKRTDAPIAIECEARAGNTYAVLGHIYGDTVASAEGLEIVVSREAPDPHSTTRPSTFSSDRVAVGGMLVGTRVPSMVAPVSQMATEPQFRERIYRDWSEHLGGGTADRSLRQWERIYAMRTFDRYDMARPGARGLVVQGGEHPDLVGALRGAGARIDASMRPGTVPAGTSETGFVALDPASVPDTVAGYDFACALRVFTGVSTGETGWKTCLGQIEELLRLVKPHGLLVVTFDVVPVEEIAPDMGRVGWQDVVRIVLVLISRGHQVAQVRRDFATAVREDDEDPLSGTVFGVIVRRRL